MRGRGRSRGRGRGRGGPAAFIPLGDPGASADEEQQPIPRRSTRIVAGK